MELEPQRFFDARGEVVLAFEDLVLTVGGLAHVGFADGRENAVQVDAHPDGQAVRGEHNVTKRVGRVNDAGVVFQAAAAGRLAARAHPQCLLQFAQFLIDEAESQVGLSLVNVGWLVPHGVPELAVKIDDVLLDGKCQGADPFNGYNVVVNIYGRDGQPMELEEFQKIPAKKRILAEKSLVLHGDRIRVVTMWDGEDMARGEAPMPCPFSTFIHSENHPNMLTAFPNESYARMGHYAAIAFVQAQGGKTGFPVFVHFLKQAFTNPRTLKLAYWNLGLMGAVTLLQLFTLTLSLFMWNWDWSDAFTTVIAAAYGYATIQTLKAIKRLRRERNEAQRLEREKEEFERIVGSFNERGTLEG